MDDGVPERISEELFEIFCYMRNTFEGIAACNNSNVWNVFGGLNRAKKAAFNVLTHELRSINFQPHEIDHMQKLCIKLVEMFPRGDVIVDTEQSPEEIIFAWIEQHLLDHSLFACIQCAFLRKSENTLLHLFKEFSFVKNEVLMEAFLCCLDALQQNAIERLSNIDPILMNKSTFMAKITPWVSDRMAEEYRIDHAPPDVKQILWPSTLQAPYSATLSCEQCGGEFFSSVEEDIICTNCMKLSRTESRLSRKSIFKESNMEGTVSPPSEDNNEHLNWYEEDGGVAIDILRSKLQRSKELTRSESSLFQEPDQADHKEVHSDLDQADERRHKISIDESKSETTSVVDMALPRSSAIVLKKTGHHRSKSDQIGVHAPKMEEKNEMDSSVPVASSLPKENIQQGSSCTYYFDSEDGQMFPKPYKGQSLISYLNSRSYDTGAQLDKENAHFSICEALITAIEQMRCQNKISIEDDQSDGDVQTPRQKVKHQKSDMSAFSDPSDGKSSSLKTSSTLSSSYGSSSTDDTDHEEAKKLSISPSWENVSIASSKTLSPELTNKSNTEKVEIIQTSEIPPGDFSAETVAKSLLQKFDLRSIPAASELKWMVTEEVTQTLLPLPLELHAEAEDGGKYRVHEGLRKISMSGLIRGNMEWAPPRPQIIFSAHPFVKRKVMLQRQHFRCAGCGLKVTPSLSKRFRFCEYIGKYFCTSCHQNKLALIPSKVLTKWDFKKYPVSDFAKEFLKKIHNDPLFNVLDVSPNLYDNVRQLNITKCLRLQLHHVKKFLRSCRLAKSELKDVMKLEMHIADDPHAFSLDDLTQVKSGDMQTVLKVIVQSGIAHIKECPLCSAKGFVCEFCRYGEDILYPFDLQKVYICQDCKTCYHRACFVIDKCARCARIKARKELLREKSPDDHTDAVNS